MDRRLVSGHSPYEGVAGFSRAVVAGDRVHVAGTAPIPPDGSPPPEAAYEQAALCLRIIGEALTQEWTDQRRADLTERVRAFAERYPLYPNLVGTYAGRATAAA